MLTGACCTTSNKEKLSNKNEPAQVAAKSETKDVTSNDDNEIVYRKRIATGSRFKKTICMTKVAWAIEEGKNKEKRDRFGLDVEQHDLITFESGPMFLT